MEDSNAYMTLWSLFMDEQRDLVPRNSKSH